MSRIHAFRDDALGELDAVGVVEALRAGRVSAPEVVEAAIARTELVAGPLGAMAHRAYERARTQARDPRGGFFAGVPTLIKDNVDVAGMPTQQGCDAFVSKLHEEDGDFARMFLATGLVPLGKSQLSEFGFSAAAEHPRLGPVRSPWDTDRVSGASSAGSAALVAAGAVPIAHANDGGGSIRIPAAVNGLVGLKPSRDRLAQDALSRQMPVRIVADGVVTRSVRDTAAFLREAEKAYRPLRLPPIGDITRPGRARLRVAVNTTGLQRGADPEVAAGVLGVARLLEQAGHHVEQVTELPVGEGFAEDFLRYWGLLALAIVRGGRLSFGPTWDAGRTDNLTRGLERHARRNLHRLPGVIARLRRAPAQSASFFERYDAVLTPTLATATPLVGHLDPTQPYEVVVERLLDWVAFTPLANVTGDPSVSLPLATDASGLPVGVMISAGLGREARLLELAYELEQMAPFASLAAAPTERLDGDF